jgi:hypothetical protein
MIAAHVRRSASLRTFRLFAAERLLKKAASRLNGARGLVILSGWLNGLEVRHSQTAVRLLPGCDSGEAKLRR